MDSGNRLRIGALVFPQFELLDLYGPLEMFGMLEERFEIRIVAETRDPVAGRGGPRTHVDDAFADARAYDVLLVPGGAGTRREVDNAALTEWLRIAAPKAQLVTSVCTGAALLARAGLLDGRRATTNKLAWAWATAQGPEVDWQARARWVADGDMMTSAGVSAGIDMSLAAIAWLVGEDTAHAVARAAEYEWDGDPDRDPFAALAGLG